MTIKRAAIIGAGPSGFYAADQLLKVGFEVDLYDALPTPFGLVRAGVAPDHPKIKSVTRVYAKTATHEAFRFFGAVTLGAEVSREDLLARYHAVVYAIGTSTDNRLGIPGEDRPGSHPATAFVAWYNGHPYFADEMFDLNGGRAVVVGNGNVAIDVARMLVLDPGELAPTDTADHAIDAFEMAGVTEVVLLGRRGPAEAAFTNPELRELGELVDADVIVDEAQMGSGAALDDPSADPTARRNVEILREYSTRKPSGRRKRVELRFLLSPLELRGEGRVESVLLARNVLEADPGGALRARASDQLVELPATTVFRAIGYRGTPLSDVPFDSERGLIANEGGRVRHGEYVVGWAKRGPSGVIGTNKKDANDTVNALLEDLVAGRVLDPAPITDAALEDWVRERQPELVDYRRWAAIDRHERDRGEPHGRPRVKLARLEELLGIRHGDG